MSLNLFGDECVHGGIVSHLRKYGFNVNYIAEVAPGISDHKIVEWINRESGILITEDSDYGKWVFVHKYQNLGVIYLRYFKEELGKISETLVSLINDKKESLYKSFVVVTTKKIRIRQI